MRYRWFVDQDKQTDEYGVPVSRAEYDEALHPKKKPVYEPKEMLAIAVVAFILIYEWFAGDSALVMYMCVSFLTFELRPLARLCLGKHGRAAGNALTGFSIAMFLGTLLWIFM
ncbi:MAG: hypothetical protein J5908_06460 [Selenomonas sp.]|nr:hypothetical protein [Selenomonas sp.]